MPKFVWPILVVTVRTDDITAFGKQREEGTSRREKIHDVFKKQLFCTARCSENVTMLVTVKKLREKNFNYPQLCRVVRHLTQWSVCYVVGDFAERSFLGETSRQCMCGGGVRRRRNRYRFEGRPQRRWLTTFVEIETTRIHGRVCSASTRRRHSSARG